MLGDSGNPNSLFSPTKIRALYPDPANQPNHLRPTLLNDRDLHELRVRALQAARALDLAESFRRSYAKGWKGTWKHVTNRHEKALGKTAGKLQDPPERYLGYMPPYPGPQVRMKYPKRKQPERERSDLESKAKIKSQVFLAKNNKPKRPKPIPLMEQKVNLTVPVTPKDQVQVVSLPLANIPVPTPTAPPQNPEPMDVSPMRPDKPKKPKTLTKPKVISSKVKEKVTFKPLTKDNKLRPVPEPEEELLASILAGTPDEMPMDLDEVELLARHPDEDVENAAPPLH